MPGAHGVPVVAGCLAALVAAGCGGQDDERRVPSDRERLARVDGIALTRAVPGAVRRACRRAAAISSVDVICPRWVPAGEMHVNFVARAVGLRRANASYVIDMSSAQIGGLHQGHWVVAAAKPTDRRALRPPGADGAIGVTRRRLHGRPVSVLKMPAHEDGGGFYGGHAVVVWRRDGVEYHVSLHGHHLAEAALRIAQSMIE
jgi:hypothetical protein